jgi:hypothetical protein
VLLRAGWSHFAQFTIAVVNKDPKKSKYSGEQLQQPPSEPSGLIDAVAGGTPAASEAAAVAILQQRQQRLC